MSTLKKYLQVPKVVVKPIGGRGNFPNNERLPLVLLQGALKLPARGGAPVIEAFYAANGWGNSWRNGIYTFHHYHATTHEAIGVYGGSITAQFGGPDGPVLSAKCGDLILIPAGVAHKNLKCSLDFRVVGGYPRGQYPDMQYGKKGERPRTDQMIIRVALPKADPIFGKAGPLMREWKKWG